ncbi:hypothetical protein GIB67_000298 [Kingdonia uniflora]|uniref:Uncharacterized protein n=1 Tax=Kingdonia uniflora TaxID=39325 RepID=A0A7J7LCI7_9MAGN|nr:hypothetical protein GIB67_000298 [Kingdonia uniflora]
MLNDPEFQVLSTLGRLKVLERLHMARLDSVRVEACAKEGWLFPRLAQEGHCFNEPGLNKRFNLNQMSSMHVL